MEHVSGTEIGDAVTGERGDGAASEDEDPIMSMVRKQLDRTNPPGTKALYGRAVRLDPSIRELSLRQFHAKYPLKIKRERARERDGA